jgi:hypothetical protein
MKREDEMKGRKKGAKLYLNLSIKGRGCSSEIIGAALAQYS